MASVKSYREPQDIESTAPTTVPALGLLAPHYDARMNKGERAYASHLDLWRAAGKVRRWWFEFVALRLADNTHYKPDFLVQLPDGALELHEVKGRKGDSFYAEEDAWIKVKVIAEHSPFAVRVVWPLKGGGWGERLV